MCLHPVPIVENRVRQFLSPFLLVTRGSLSSSSPRRRRPLCRLLLLRYCACYSFRDCCFCRRAFPTRSGLTRPASVESFIPTEASSNATRGSRVNSGPLAAVTVTATRTPVVVTWFAVRCAGVVAGLSGRLSVQLSQLLTAPYSFPGPCSDHRVLPCLPAPEFGPCGVPTTLLGVELD